MGCQKLTYHQEPAFSASWKIFSFGKEKNVSGSKFCIDYYAGGMVMPGRSGNANSYKYGFNGMLKDDEIKGEGNSYDFGARMYDPRVMRWLSLDPAARDYPSMSDYSAMGNNPILYIDPDGERIYIYYTSKDENGKTINKAYEYGSGLKLPNDKFVRKAVRTLKKLEKRGKDPYGIINNLSNDKDEHIAIVQKETWNSSAVIFEFGNVVFEDNTLTKDDFVIPPDEIHWNTRSGLISPDGKKKTSSGMGLLHEIGHKYFYMFINGTEEDKTGKPDDWIIQNVESGDKKGWKRNNHNEGYFLKTIGGTLSDLVLLMVGGAKKERCPILKKEKLLRNLVQVVKSQARLQNPDLLDTCNFV